jgi:hypothetical protein
MDTHARDSAVEESSPPPAHADAAFRWASSAVALSVVIFLWGFWTRGIEACGLNLAVIWIGTCGALSLLTPSRSPLHRDNLIWTVPVSLAGASYALYDNYFIKGVNLIVLPLMLGVLFQYAHHQSLRTTNGSVSLLLRLIARTCGVLSGTITAAVSYLSWLRRSAPGKGGTTQRVLIGIFALFVLAGIIVIPLLASSDPVFRVYVSDFYEMLFRALSLPQLVGRILVFLLVASALGAFGARLPSPLSLTSRTAAPVDSIIAGIVLSGILVIYGAFLALQVERLFLGTLPTDFKTTEALVKNGFWQLMFLTTLNIGLVTLARGRVANVVTWILRAFALASLLLLASAASRMALYVLYYGLSYEKFFASYAVLYCALLLGGLIYATFSLRAFDAVKFGTGLFVGMYVTATALPIDLTILHTNIALSRLENSRIELSDMKMLSPDALSSVSHLASTGALPYYPSSNDAERSLYQNRSDWAPWIARRTREVSNKSWYEMSLSNLFYLAGNF